MNLSNLTIIYEDSDILVCKKPAGIAVQNARMGTPDMVSILKNYLYKSNAPSSKSGKSEPYLAVIHRLDQPVEGVLVFAKTPFAAKELNREMQQGGFGKHYRALVHGVPPKESDTLEDYLVKDGRTNTSRVCTKDTKDAKLARLTYRIIPSENVADKADNKYSESETANAQLTTLLDITLDTGRHHQIRVQMAHMGCPIVGDQKYGNQSATREHISTRSARTKLELCAYQLEFHHPKTKKLLTFHF